jgi:hypothetical protein
MILADESVGHKEEVLFRKTEVGWRVLSFLLVAVMAVLLFASLSPVRGAALTGWVLVPILAFVMLIALLFGSITVSITRDWVKLKLGLGMIRRTEPRNGIVRVRTLPHPCWGPL